MCENLKIKQVIFNYQPALFVILNNSILKFNTHVIT